MPTSRAFVDEVTIQVNNEIDVPPGVHDDNWVDLPDQPEYASVIELTEMQKLQYGKKATDEVFVIQLRGRHFPVTFESHRFKWEGKVLRPIAGPTSFGRSTQQFTKITVMTDPDAEEEGGSGS